jgi:hypothetical protein
LIDEFLFERILNMCLSFFLWKCRSNQMVPEDGQISRGVWKQRQSAMLSWFFIKLWCKQHAKELCMQKCRISTTVLMWRCLSVRFVSKKQTKSWCLAMFCFWIWWMHNKVWSNNVRSWEIKLIKPYNKLFLSW